MPFNIILLGAPGSGKGTQAKLLGEHFSVNVICMGDIVRNEMSNNTAEGQQMKSFIETGDLVPDELVIKMFSNVVTNGHGPTGFISDGFPRTIKQANFYDELMSTFNLNTFIFLIDVGLKTYDNSKKYTRPNRAYQ